MGQIYTRLGSHPSDSTRFDRLGTQPDIVGVVDDLKREVERDAELQDATRYLADLLSRADLDQLREAAERNDLDAIAKALDLPSVDRLEALAAFLRDRADHYKRYPDLERYRQDRRRSSHGR